MGPSITVTSADFTVPPSCTGCGGGGPNPGATPELGSLLLFGSGLLGGAGYLLNKRRAARSIPRD